MPNTCLMNRVLHNPFPMLICVSYLLPCPLLPLRPPSPTPLRLPLCPPPPPGGNAAGGGLPDDLLGELTGEHGLVKYGGGGPGNEIKLQPPAARAALEGKVYGIYFSAHWCPPCRQFTPRLAQTYNALRAAGREFEVRRESRRDTLCCCVAVSLCRCVAVLLCDVCCVLCAV